MIISIHVPKTAGTSFGQSLKATFGERLLLDYGDWAGFNSPEAIARRAARAVQMRARRDELLERFDLIHGHFVADKYLDLFPHTDFVAFLRDPYQQTLSNYFYLLRNPQLQDQHPAVKVFHEAKMTIFDYLSWNEVRNPQAAFLGSIPVESLAMIGLTEQYVRSVALFNAVFGYNISSDFASNVNSERQEVNYEISHELRKAIDRFRGADLDLYRRAKEIFANQTASRLSALV
jgi:hypothetical protein